MACEIDGARSDGHLFRYPVEAGDLCGCGEVMIARTVKTGTWNGLSVMSWETVASCRAEGAEGAEEGHDA